MKPVIIRVASGRVNFISNNHVVATAPEDPGAAGDSCFSMQVRALLGTKESESLEVTTVLVEPGAVENAVMDSGTESQVILDKTVNRFRADPGFAE